MRNLSIVILSFLILQASCFGQVEDLPEIISITDNYSSPWGTNLEYRYSLVLKKNRYKVIRTYQNQNGQEKKKSKTIGSVSLTEIVELLDFLKKDESRGIEYKNFAAHFTPAKVIENIKKNSSNYWISSEAQKNFLIELLTEPKDVKKNLESYYTYSDQSFYLDGPRSQLRVSFILYNREVTILSNSVLEYALPMSVNGEKVFSPRLARVLAKVVPKSKTDRPGQLSGKNLSEHVANQVIRNNGDKLARIEVLDYAEQTNNLKSHFRVTNLRIVNGTYSTNWGGEKRYNCQLWSLENDLNLSIMYSSRIKKSEIVYPPSIIIDQYDTLINRLLSIDFFKNFLQENRKRKISIIFDDDSSFTDKTKESILSDCGLTIDSDNALYLAVWNEYDQLSSWIIQPNGEYMLWNEFNAKAKIPVNDTKFIQCRKE